MTEQINENKLTIKKSESNIWFNRRNYPVLIVRANPNRVRALVFNTHFASSLILFKQPDASGPSTNVPIHKHGGFDDYNGDIYGFLYDSRAEAFLEPAMTFNVWEFEKNV